MTTGEQEIGLWTAGLESIARDEIEEGAQERFSAYRENDEDLNRTLQLDSGHHREHGRTPAQPQTIQIGPSFEAGRVSSGSLFLSSDLRLATIQLRVSNRNVSLEEDFVEELLTGRMGAGMHEQTVDGCDSEPRDQLLVLRPVLQTSQFPHDRTIERKMSRMKKWMRKWQCLYTILRLTGTVKNKFKDFEVFESCSILEVLFPQPKLFVMEYRITQHSLGL